MERVPQKVLNWLHSVLIGEYFDVNRTFADVAQTLESYPTLRPSTEVYTFENGTSALLLHLTGTIPVLFRGGRYSFPVSLWIPKSYPSDAPIAFVTPTQDMVIRPGQHISGEGRIYHPYLANWRSGSQLLNLVRVLQDIFSKEPPVVARPANVQIPASQSAPRAPTIPPLPGNLRQIPPASPINDGAPLPPPKPFDQRSISSSNQPPVPPRPEMQSPHPRTPAQSFHQHPIPSPRQPPLPQYQNGSQLAPIPMHTQQPYQSASQAPIRHIQPAHETGISPNRQSYPPQPNQPQPYPPQQQVQYGAQSQPQHIPPKPKPQAIDLLTSPFDLPLPTQADLPAPPIPRNPEKDALLSAISQRLTVQIQSTVAANTSAIPPLSAQHAAMTHAMHKLQQEKGDLLHLQTLLNSNEQILHQAMRDADECIASAQHKAIPSVDEVLVAPTIVSQQLYNLVAEERACVDTREVLGRALDRGRISSEAWVKTVRSLAREEFLKKVLIKKCAEGMGLQMDNI